MKYKLSALIMFIILISSCVIPTIFPPIEPILRGYALEITELEVIPPTAPSGSTVRVTMEIENLGDTTVYKNTAFGYFLGSGIGDQEVLIDKDMEPANEMLGTQPTRETLTWNVKVPSLERGQMRIQTFIGRVYQYYVTKAHGNIWVYTESESKALESAGKSLQYSSFDYGNGPIGIGMSVSPSPVIIYENYKIFSLSIRLRKIGSGTIFDWGTVIKRKERFKNIKPDDLNIISVEISEPDGLDIGDECRGTQTLIPGRDITLTCDVKVDKKIKTFESFPIEISVQHGYFTEKTTSITVEGTKETPLPGSACCQLPRPKPGDPYQCWMTSKDECDDAGGTWYSTYECCPDEKCKSSC